MVERYGVYGRRIWGLWWKDMGSTVEEYGAYGGKIWGIEK